MLWSHYEARMDPEFRRLTADVVAQSDAVLLEYTFWGSPVLTLSRRLGRKSIVTAHDVLADQVKQTPWLRKLTFREEVRTLRAADDAVCVSPDDQVTFGRAGVRSVVIPHGIDSAHSRPYRSEPGLHQELEGRIGVQIPHGTLCLFVGSSFAANVTAVSAIREFARRSRADGGQPMTFIVVGGCCLPEVDQNFVACGQVDEATLGLAYRVADAVLIPLTSGTGASVKTIEAMARGKVVVGTTTAFRGWAVSPGLDCLVCDDMTSYCDVVRQVCRDPARRQQLETNARRFAEGFDYRRTNTRYVEMIADPDQASGESG